MFTLSKQSVSMLSKLGRIRTSTETGGSKVTVDVASRMHYADGTFEVSSFVYTLHFKGTQLACAHLTQVVQDLFKPCRGKGYVLDVGMYSSFIEGLAFQNGSTVEIHFDKAKY